MLYIIVNSYIYSLHNSNSFLVHLTTLAFNFTEFVFLFFQQLIIVGEQLVKRFRRAGFLDILLGLLFKVDDHLLILAFHGCILSQIDLTKARILDAVTLVIEAANSHKPLDSMSLTAERATDDQANPFVGLRRSKV